MCSEGPKIPPAPVSYLVGVLKRPRGKQYLPLYRASYHHEVASIPLGEVGKFFENPLMNTYTPLPKAAKPAWAKQYSQSVSLPLLVNDISGRHTHTAGRPFALYHTVAGDRESTGLRARGKERELRGQWPLLCIIKQAVLFVCM